MNLHLFAQVHKPNREARLCPEVPTQILASGPIASGYRRLHNGIAKLWIGRWAGVGGESKARTHCPDLPEAASILLLLCRSER